MALVLCCSCSVRCFPLREFPLLVHENLAANSGPSSVDVELRVRSLRHGRRETCWVDGTTHHFLILPHCWNVGWVLRKLAGLIFAYLLLTSLLTYSNSPTKAKFSLLFSLSIALFLTHPWTWALVTVASSAFAISLWWQTSGHVHLKSAIGVLAGGFVLDFVKSFALFDCERHI